METAEQLSGRLRSDGDKLVNYLRGLAEAEWNAPVYTEGATWTVRSIVAHLMSAELAFLKLFEQIRRGGEGIAEDFEIDRYNASQQVKNLDLAPAQLLNEFQSARQAMTALVSELSAEDLQRRGRHPFLGVTALIEMVRMVYIHNQTHYRDIRRALQRGQAA